MYHPGLKAGFFVVRQLSLGLLDRSMMQTYAIEYAVLLLGRSGYSSLPRRQIEQLAAVRAEVTLHAAEEVHDDDRSPAARS
jgi:hypothetical protein